MVLRDKWPKASKQTKRSFFKCIRSKKLPRESVKPLGDQDIKGFIEEKLNESFRKVFAIPWETPMLRTP